MVNPAAFKDENSYRSRFSLFIILLIRSPFQKLRPEVEGVSFLRFFFFFNISLKIPCGLVRILLLTAHCSGRAEARGWGNWEHCSLGSPRLLGKRLLLVTFIPISLCGGAEGAETSPLSWQLQRRVKLRAPSSCLRLLLRILILCGSFLLVRFLWGLTSQRISFQASTNIWWRKTTIITIFFMREDDVIFHLLPNQSQTTSESIGKRKKLTTLSIISFFLMLLRIAIYTQCQAQTHFFPHLCKMSM